MSTEKEREAHREAMYEMIRRYESSTESRKSFCEKESIAQSTFTYWLRRYRKKQSESAGSFIAIKSVERKAQIDLEYPGGFQGAFWSFCYSNEKNINTLLTETFYDYYFGEFGATYM
ncbi:MAG: IS66 family insertion sequence element accessory protein TnpA [Bacteroidales bacterium]